MKSSSPSQILLLPLSAKFEGRRRRSVEEGALHITIFASGNISAVAGLTNVYFVHNNLVLVQYEYG